MGLWRVTEMVYHKRVQGQGFYNFIHSRICPTVHIAQESKSDLRLVWNERDFSVYYKARINDRNSPGFWSSSGPHNGKFKYAKIMSFKKIQNLFFFFFSDTMLEPNYEINFNGVIQVMKAVGTHVVLTFCIRQSKFESELFSALLTREFERIPPGTMISVNRMLERRKLEPVFIKRTCSGASKTVSALLLQMIVLVTWRFLL